MPDCVVRAGASVTGEPIRFIGKEMLLKLASDGNGSITILEDVSPPRNGPPLHAHPFEEFFYITRGRFHFEMDGKPIEAGPGDLVHVPANVPHVFQNISDEEGRMLILARPGGIERYFAELAERMVHDAANTAAFAQLAVDYGITILGPPLAARKA